MKTVHQAAREVPVLRETEVLVIGGGPAGFGAAVASARNGARALLVERYGFLGGKATAGLVRGLSGVRIGGRRVVGGIPWELVLRMEKLGGAASNAGGPGVPYDFPLDPEILKYMANEMVLEAGAQILLHSSAVDTIREGNVLRGVMIESKSGRHALLGKVIIDATGDGDVAARGDVPHGKGRPGDGFMQNMTLVFILGGLNTDELWETWASEIDGFGTRHNRLRRLMQEARERGDLPAFGGPWVRGSVNGVRPSEMYVNVVRQWGDATSVEELTRAEIQGRRDVMAFLAFFQETVPELAECRLVQTGVQIGLRESRRIVGEYTLTRADIRAGGPFPDVIARGAHPIDIHPPTDSEDQTLDHLRRDYGIPYRCLVARGVSNLLAAGRCIWATHGALATTRVMGTCMALGQAAGTAAALAVQEGVAPRDVDVATLQGTLTAQGAIIT
jgi:hypothetical protein